MSYSLNALKGDLQGTSRCVLKVDTKSLNYIAHIHP